MENVQGYYEHGGQRTDFFKVNLLTIDQPQQGLDLRDFEITYVDGLTVSELSLPGTGSHRKCSHPMQDTWELGPKPFPGGTY